MDIREHAVMTVDEGEEIAGMWITDELPSTGFFKVLAKKKVDGSYEMAHFFQRADGTKHSVLRVEAKAGADLNNVITMMNDHFKKSIPGVEIILKPAAYDVYTIPEQSNKDKPN